MEENCTATHRACMERIDKLKMTHTHTFMAYPEMSPMCHISLRLLRFRVVFPERVKAEGIGLIWKRRDRGSGKVLGFLGVGFIGF